MQTGIPEKLTNFAIYKDGKDMLGMADVTLPELEYMTETISGAGIAGEIDSPVPGHFKSFEISIKWRTVTKSSIELSAPKAHHLDMRGSIQFYDPKAGGYVSVPLKVVAQAMPKKAGLGKLEMGKPQDNESSFEVHYLKVWLDGEEYIEIDKFNYKCVIDGTDYLESVRSDLGK